jgi:hypothetical protein
MPPSETKKALIVVRTYPVPAKTGVEVSCTAAITDKGEWLRLFPIPYRLLDEDKKFRKYQWVNVEAIKATKDSRPESYRASSMKRSQSYRSRCQRRTIGQLARLSFTRCGRIVCVACKGNGTKTFIPLLDSFARNP